MLCRSPTFDEVVELWIARHAVIPDQECRVDRRMRLDQPIDQRNHGVIGIRTTEDDLKRAAIARPECGAQRVLNVVLQPAHRPQNRHPRCSRDHGFLQRALSRPKRRANGRNLQRRCCTQKADRQSCQNIGHARAVTEASLRPATRASLRAIALCADQSSIIN